MPPKQNQKLSAAQRMHLDRRDPRLDWSRAELTDPRDPLAKGPPCNGRHDTSEPQCRVANQFMVKYRCLNCRIQLLYVPRRGCTGEYRRATPLTKDHNPAGRGVRTSIPEAPPPPPEPEKPRRKGPSPPPTRKSPQGGSYRTYRMDANDAQNNNESADGNPDDKKKAPEFNPRRETKKEFAARMAEWLAEQSEGSDSEEKKSQASEDEISNPTFDGEDQWKLLREMAIDQTTKRKKAERGSEKPSRAASPSATTPGQPSA